MRYFKIIGILLILASTCTAEGITHFLASHSSLMRLPASTSWTTIPKDARSDDKIIFLAISEDERFVVNIAAQQISPLGEAQRKAFLAGVKLGFEKEGYKVIKAGDRASVKYAGYILSLRGKDENQEVSQFSWLLFAPMHTYIVSASVLGEASEKDLRFAESLLNGFTPGK